jgi:Zn-dependent protease
MLDSVASTKVSPASSIQHPASSIMFLGEPAPSPADLHFRLFGIPVRVSPWFWGVSLLLGMSGGQADPVNTLIWVAVVFVSILVHELGHAFTQRFFGGRPWITLYSFGGLASCNDCDRSPRSQILILLAGPFAGFALATLVIIGMRLTGHVTGFAWSAERVDFESTGLERLLIQPLGLFVAYFEPLASRPMNHVVADLLQVNILWGLVNLLPIYPLDGGQISRELFALGNPRSGIIRSLQVSTGMAALVAVYALTQQQLFMCIMFGLLAYSSYQALQGYRNSWR